MAKLEEIEPTEQQRCDNCGLLYDYWLLFFANLNKSICEECLEDALGIRNELRWGLRDEA